MMTALFILIIHMLDLLFFNWWLDPFLAFLQRLTVFVGGVNSHFAIVITTFRFVVYFVPVAHLIVLIGVITTVTMIRVITAIYNQIAQVIP